jgi:two-component system, sensor histidine kinase ChiS
MKIKYKLIFLFIVITLMALLPVSMILLQRQENERMIALQHQGEVFSQFLSQSVVNIILANGADIQTCRIDAREMISSLRSLTSDGLVFAESVLISKRKDYNGVVLARFDSARGALSVPGNEKILAGGSTMIIENHSLKEISMPDRPGIFYEFTAIGSFPGKSPLCMSRLVYSKSLVLAPVAEVRRITFMIVFAALIFVGMLGYLFSRFISKPIVALTETARKIEQGNLDIRVNVVTRDEVGHLSSTFNHMLHLIRQKIAELESSNKRLLDLDVLKDEFLANISHELKTPLYGMVGIAESLIRGATGPLNDETNSNIKTIIASGKSLGSLVSDILDFSKMKHYDIILDIHQVDMHDIAQCVLSITQPLIGKKNIVLENRIEPGYAIVEGDESRLQQILMNLVSNSVKFTDSGSIYITAKKDDEEVEVAVVDTGIGISPDMKNIIFEPFQQIDGSITRKYGGSGLGLAITKKLVELHGGKVRVDSEPGKGSSFSFTIKKSASIPTSHILPENHESSRTFDVITQIDKKIHQEKQPAIKQNRSNEKNLQAKILVVDDEPVNLLIVINHLKMEGYDVVTAENSDQVDEMFIRGEIPDLILLDVMLPRVSGYDICRKIRERYSSHELPIVMLTARQTTQDIIAGISAGANDYLIKPVNGEELCARVSNLVSMKNSVKVQSELKIIRNELALAIELQRNILPTELPKVDGLHFAVRYIPSSNVSGDFYDYHVKNGSKIGVIIADVAGHGVPAAMISSMMQMAYSFSKLKRDEPSEILADINTILGNYPLEIYLTACCLLIDMETHTIRFSNAGHPPLLVYRKSDNELMPYTVFGRPIGMFDDAEYTTKEFTLKVGDRIIMFTDGIIEAWSPKHEIFGDDRFYELIREYGYLNADDFADQIVKAVYEWTDVNPDRGLSDDVTLVVMDLLI